MLYIQERGCTKTYNKNHLFICKIMEVVGRSFQANHVRNWRLAHRRAWRGFPIARQARQHCYFLVGLAWPLNFVFSAGLNWVAGLFRISWSLVLVFFHALGCMTSLGVFLWCVFFLSAFSSSSAHSLPLDVLVSFIVTHSCLWGNYFCLVACPSVFAMPFCIIFLVCLLGLFKLRDEFVKEFVTQVGLSLIHLPKYPQKNKNATTVNTTKYK